MRNATFSIVIFVVLAISSCASQSIFKRKLLVPSPKLYQTGNNDFVTAQHIRFQFSFESAAKLLSVEQVQHFYELVEDYHEQQFNLHSKINPVDSYLEVKSKVVVKDISHYTKFTQLEHFKEGYTLKVGTNLEIEIEIENYTGFVRAIQTLAQILQTNQKQGLLGITGLPILITDEPSFAHRGIMIDCARHFVSITELKKTIDGMVANKLNVLHLHLTDSQSFPVEMTSYPQITQSGVYSSDQTYTISDIESLEQYARTQAVILIPEADVPAHTRAWSNDPTFNDIDACRDYPYSQWRNYCLEPPCGQLDPTMDKSYEVVSGVLKDFQNLFSSEYMHLGGDEAQAGCWNARPSIQSFMTQNNIKDYYELQTYFRKRIDPFVTQKKIYWFNGDAKKIGMNETDHIQYWDSINSYQDLQLVNNQVILSPYDQLYLDCGLTNLIGGQNWCDMNTWKHIYAFEPFNAPIDQSRILGAQACLWTETAQSQQIQELLWPRATALAMRLWNHDEKLGTLSLAERLLSMNDYLKKFNINSQPISSEFCEKNLMMCFDNSDAVSNSIISE